MIAAGEEDAVGVIDHPAAERRAAAKQLYGFKVLKSEHVKALSGKDTKVIMRSTCHDGLGCGARSRRAMGRMRSTASG